MFDLSTLVRRSNRTEIVTGKIVSPTKVMLMSGETVKFSGVISMADIGRYAKMVRTVDGLILLNTVARDTETTKTYIV